MKVENLEEKKIVYNHAVSNQASLGVHNMVIHKLKNVIKKEIMHVQTCSVRTVHVCTHQIYRVLIYNLLFCGPNQGASVIWESPNWISPLETCCHVFLDAHPGNFLN